MLSNADYLRAAMDAQGVTDNATRAALAAICMGESKMQGYVERGYAHTSNDRIREVFGERVACLSYTELDALKANDEAFFGRVYGPGFRTGVELGNKTPEDGYDFRGRGFIQLTGRANYQRYADKVGHPEIMQNPDLANDPAIAAQLAVAYILDRYHGGGMDAMMRCVGNNTPDIAAAKEAYYRRFLASGEFNYVKASQPGGITFITPGHDPEPETDPAPGQVGCSYPIHQQVGVAAIVPSSVGIAAWVASLHGLHIPADVVGDICGVLTAAASLFTHLRWGKR